MTTRGHEGSFTTSDGITLAYTRHPAGAHAAGTLVLVHSLALDRSIWNGVLEHLPERVDVLTYDCRGHGRSSRVASGFTAELFARDLAELLDHVGWSRAVVAGCSMGGCVAQAFAGLHPDRIAGLGLIDTTAWYGPEAPTQFRQRAAAAKANGMAGLIGFQVTRWFSDAFREAHPDIVEAVTSVFLANDFDCYEATCALLGDADLRRYLPSIAVPVAIVVGEEDYATPVAMARQLHEQVPGSSLTIVQGGRHLTPIECPDRIASELTTLLRTQPHVR
ncbi:MAG: alpha/beta fold hydrolase [Vicinamibacterales bacterium]